MCRLTFQDASILSLMAQLPAERLEAAQGLVPRLSAEGQAISAILQATIRDGAAPRSADPEHLDCAMTFLNWAEELHATAAPAC